MGIGGFGGFFYKITIKNTIFELVYVEDAHEMEPFKYQKTDTSFVEDLELKVDDASLIFSQNILSIQIFEDIQEKTN